MSDTKQIEDHKTFWKRSTMEIITYTEGSLADILQLARKDILSLLTTIESQKEEIENLREMKIRRIEVENGAINFSIQGEAGMSFAAILLKFYEDNGGKNFFTFDVEKDGMRLSTTIENKHGELTVFEKLNQQSREIESLKAITELAVKGLNRMLSITSDGSENDTWNGSTGGSGHKKCRSIAIQALSDIGRLQNAQT